MTELLEKIATGLVSEFRSQCPFDDASDGADEDEEEDPPEDDRPAAKPAQSSSGGVLGKNLISGSPGSKGTVGGPCPSDEMGESKRIDTRREKVYVTVLGTEDIETRQFGFTVAAHHLIPGVDSLAKSQLVPFMKKNGKVTITVFNKGTETEKEKKISKHIGYNVNGAHNGVWLPGNYYIRSRTSPRRKKTWSELNDDQDWCLHYVAATCKAAGGQFHDTHTKYSAKVKNILNEIALKLSRHECEDCEDESINPPFRIKARLYTFSGKLRTRLKGAPGAWKAWFSSDGWSRVFGPGRAADKKAFMKAYLAARVGPRVKSR